MNYTDPSKRDTYPIPYSWLIILGLAIACVSWALYLSGCSAIQVQSLPIAQLSKATLTAQCSDKSLGVSQQWAVCHALDAAIFTCAQAAKGNAVDMSLVGQILAVYPQAGAAEAIVANINMFCIGAGY